MEKAGVIYILTNPSFPEYVKIGYADDVNKRLAQLNKSECIPFAFRVYATYDVSSRLSDLKIHEIIDSPTPTIKIDIPHIMIYVTNLDETMVLIATKNINTAVAISIKILFNLPKKSAATTTPFVKQICLIALI